MFYDNNFKKDKGMKISTFKLKKPRFSIKYRENVVIERRKYIPAYRTPRSFSVPARRVMVMYSYLIFDFYKTRIEISTVRDNDVYRELHKKYNVK